LAEYNIHNGLKGSHNRLMPIQTIPKSKKNKAWKDAMADFLYREAVAQRRRNSVFTDIKKMTQGEFVYRSVDLEKTLAGNPDYAILTGDVPLPTHLKHFDFLGIIANAIKGAFSEIDSKYRVESFDEYYVNDFILAKTEKYKEYAQRLLKLQVDSYLIKQGLNPERAEFNSEEEKQQYLQQLEQAAAEYTPEEVEKDLQKNFKVVAVEWSNNVLTSDKEKFNLENRDGERLVEFILTGKWFRHYRMGYDYYDIEDWEVEEVFHSEYVNTKYPQDCEFIGRLTEMSISDALNKYGHRMTPKQQKEVGDFFGQGEDYKLGVTPAGNGTSIGLPFGENLIMPFENYLDHNINLQMEAALGAPLAQTKIDDNTIVRHWMPRAGSLGGLSKGISSNMRSDILVSDASIEVVEAYWTSYERYGILIYENEIGQIDVEMVTEDLAKDFIKEKEIRIQKTYSMKKLREDIERGKIDDHINTIQWFNKPVSYDMVILKTTNAFNIKEDIILGGEEILQQIKGDSNIFQNRHPVGGLIGNAVIKKAFPYQQLHNICLNQISELLRDELGVFYTVDINSLASEYKGESTAESINNISQTIRDTRILPVDPSRANTQGSAVYPNIFQRNEVVFATQVQYRDQMAERFKQMGLQQIGITQQMLGAPTTYQTAEGVQQQGTASYALISNIIDDFNTSKAKANELHLAIAQQCEVNGYSSTSIIKNSDGVNSFINILSEDPDYFPLRKLSVLPSGNSSDRAVVKTLQQMLISDNTIQKDFSDLVEIVANPYVLRLVQKGKEMRKRQEQLSEQQRQHENQMLDKQLMSEKENLNAERQHILNVVDKKGEWQYKSAYLQALGRDSASTEQDNMSDITKAFKANLDADRVYADIEFKNKQLLMKENDSEENKKSELEKIKQKSEELRIRREKIASDKYVATINKN